MYLTGILQALGIVVISTLFNIYIRVNTVLFDIEPIIFACAYLVATALSLSIFAGPGRFVVGTLKTSKTWIYGFILVGSCAVDIYLVKYLSGTELSIFSRIAVPISFLLAVIFLKRKPIKTDLINIFSLSTGVLVILLMQPKESLYGIFILGFISALLLSISFMVAETHKQSVTAQSIGNLRDRARVVGFVTFITSMIFLSIVFVLSCVKEMLLPLALQESLAFVPSLDKFLHAPTLWGGVLFGAVLSPFTRYFQWSSTYKIKTENVLTILAIIPFTTLICEWVMCSFPFLSEKCAGFDTQKAYILLGVSLLMAMGAALSSFLKFKKDLGINSLSDLKHHLKEALSVNTENISIHHSATAQDDYEVVCATLEYTAGDKEKASELLGITSATLTVLHEGKGTLALESEYSQQIMRRYRREVANKDALTGRLNRSGFMTAFKQHIEGAESASILFIDLNKFKPVNDTYGHDAGDFILQGTGERLTALFNQDAYVCRLGGDEFVVLCLGIDENQAIIKAEEIKKIIAEPFKFNGNAITVGASVGIATYPTDSTNPEELLKKADEGMYREKEER